MAAPGVTVAFWPSPPPQPAANAIAAAAVRQANDRAFHPFKRIRMVVFRGLTLVGQLVEVRAEFDDRVGEVIDIGVGAEEDLVGQPDHLFRGRLFGDGT